MPESELLPGDPYWPAGLSDLPDPPVRLRVRGTLPRLTGAVALVGTRYADDEALELARALARELAAAGRVIVSGGAVGVDAAAHQGALDVGGLTVSVLATGFDPPYPKVHRGLFGRIERSGALISEQPDGPDIARWAFLKRNRLIAALAQSVVVVQAPERSGALSTAAVAVKIKRQVFTVPYAPWDVRGSGCLELLRRGVRICTSARDVLSVPAREAGPALATAADSGAEPGPEHAENLFDVSQLDDDSRAVLQALGARPAFADNLARTLGLPIMRVQRALAQLLICGLAVDRGPGRYAKAPQSSTR